MDLINFLINVWVDFWTKELQSIEASLTYITSPFYFWFFLLIYIKVYRKFFFK